ncbi:E3 ubiquitin-protein ligase UBR4-like protein [Dinothrombium tinctorium]|uniref:E3 ubiquitin-protein ligase UBR4-like protein n=1 Tax=Dinothrombium tinctorium TaxID=1965070 RepID=A0A443RP59_9ACAR|nr:E3 ubiquitin-protein ligase UBR4-like protein [Dinothrombium tinctorium]
MVVTKQDESEAFEDSSVGNQRTENVSKSIPHEMDIGSQLSYSIIPLLQSQPTSNLTKHDVVALIKTLIQLEKTILNYSLSFHPDYVSFFSSLVALSANCIVINAAASLCDDVPPLLKSDVISLCAIFKSGKIPRELAPKQDRQTTQVSFTHSETEDVKEPKRMRLDHTCDSLVEQLITPIIDVNKRDYQDSEKNIMSSAGFSTFGLSSKTALLSKNLFSLQQLGGANILLDFIQSLNTVRNYIQPVLAAEEGAPLKLPTTVSDAFSVVKTAKTLIKEYDIMWKILNLPILEPLTEDKLNIVITIIHTCLYISLSLATASSILTINGSSLKSTAVIGATAAGMSMKDETSAEENDNYLITEIVEMSLEIYRRVITVMKNSLRVGGQCCQNAHLFACWMLLSGVKYILNLTPSKSSTTHKSEDSSHVHKGKQGHITMCIPLVGHALKTLSSLLDDLKFETGLTGVGIRIEKLTGASSGSFKHNKFGCYSAWQRIEMLMSNINLTSLLFSIASHGIELIAPTSGFVSGGISDIDDECCFSSDDSSRDEDSEPILGHLFKESEREENREQEAQRSKTRSPAFALDSDKREPHKHLSLALQIFDLFNSRFVCFEVESLRVYLKATLTDPQIIILANIIRDLDRESSLFSSGFYLDFSRTLSSFVHNLIATETLSSNYQTILLTHLGVNPNPAANSIWPLNIPPRTLSVLAQVLLLRQRKETNELRSDSGAPCLFMWQSLLNHLKELILCNPDDIDSKLENGEQQDINVEHAQLLLFIFHNLKLLQRKNVLLMLSQTIVDISPCVLKPLRDYQIHMISRVLHFFEYMMKNLYEPPHSLIEQIDNNLLKSHTLISSRRDKDNNNKEATLGQSKMYFNCRTIEENYNKYSLLSGEKISLQAMKPRFYYLMNVDSFVNKDIPKLDGMALSFVLTGISEVLEYDILYDALVQFLLIGNQIDFANRHIGSQSAIPKLSFFGVCATQYCFNVAWRLFLQMPPSLKYLDDILSNDIVTESHKILHLIIWVPRIASNKWFFYWVRDALAKLTQNRPHVKPETLLRNVIKNAASVTYSVKLLNHCMNNILKTLPNSLSNDYISQTDLPKLFEMFVLESLVAKTMVTLDTCFNLSDNNFSSGKRDSDSCGSPPGTIQEAKQGAAELLSPMIKLITVYYSYIRWNLLHSLVNEDEQFHNLAFLQAHNSLLRVTSSKSSGKVTSFTLAAAGYLPKALTKALDKWNIIQVESSGSSWRNEYSSASIPSEVFIMNIENYHYNSLSSCPLSETSSNFQISGSIKRVTSTLLKFAEEIFIWSLGSSSAFSNHHQSILFDEFAKVVIPLSLDATLDSFYSSCSQAIDAIWSSKESDDYLTAVYVEVLSNLYDLLLKYSQNVSEKILIESVKFMESLLESVAGQIALEKFFCDTDVNEMSDIEEAKFSKDIVTLLKSAATENLGSAYATSVLKFLTKLFEQTEKNPDTISLVRLCTSLSRLSHSDTAILQSWLNKILCTKEANGEMNLVVNQENRMHLQSLTSYIVKESSPVDEDVALAFLSALLPMANSILSCSLEITGFPDLMIIMATLAGAGSGIGHLNLIKTVVELLETCKNYLSQKEVIEKLEQNVPSGRHQIVMESCCYLLSYLADVFEALKIFQSDASFPGRSSSPDPEMGAAANDMDSDWVDDICPDEDESTGEESDEDSFCNKLCTFTVTQKEFMNQHWYHCHTCKMVDGVGVCTICARVCHKDHDVTYAKYGSFFCDCGAKTDGSCLALVKRVPTTNASEQSSYRLPAYSNENESGTQLTSSLRRRNSSGEPNTNASASDDHGKRKNNADAQSRHQTLARQLHAKKTEIINFLMSKNVSGIVLDLLQYITPAVKSNCQRYSSAGCSIRARKELLELHKEIKGLETSDQLMVPTLGSQEGAFENVRLNYSGEQGQTIRQLISTNVIRRVAMCALTSPYGKRQHLAVSHEKGKITLLQLAALLKQADSSKRKLTLTRLVSAPIPFTALSLAANQCNEDFLAVCGLKDCHVLTFNQSGHVSGHIVLHPQLEAGNYVIKSIWLPGTQTELALITADFVKIYDLSVDVTNPQYFFILPSGKIRDVTFVFSENGEKHVLIISSMGYIYCQIMGEESAAKNGPFYVTTMLEVKNPEVKETSGGFMNCGGVSIYYSHTFQMLFFSYVNGKSFIAPLKEIVSEISNLFLIEMKSSNGSPSNSNGSKSSSKDASVPQPLCQWSEVPGHPGLVLAMCQQSNNPVVFMIKPSVIVVQKIKFLNIKAKITDMVALRHMTSPGEMRTTLILLCEDGSLRIYMASQETNYWLRPSINSSHLFPGTGLGSTTSSYKSLRKKKSNKTRPSLSASNLSAPVDFFEHCTPLNDIEFGGNDVLHIYNTAQLKNRLNTTGMYIASTKPGGFTIEVYNNDPSMVMVGVRILLGTQDINKAPSCIDLFERSVRVYLTRSRWFDFPFTREESLSADKKLSIFFGASGDSSNVTMVDSIKVYGKTKELFSWPDEDNDYSATATSSSAPSSCDYATIASSYGQQLSTLDRLLSCSLEVIEGSFTIGSAGVSSDEKQSQRTKALDIGTSLLTLPFPMLVQKNIKYLLLTLHQNKAFYNNHRDAAILNYVIKSLVDATRENELDGEAFYRLISITRSIANSRPNNLIKFGECLTAAMTLPSTDSTSTTTSDPVDIEMTTFSSNVKTATSPEISMSQSCYELSGHGSKSDQQSAKPAKHLNVSSNQRSVSFSDVQPKENSSSGASFMTYLSEAFWKLYNMRPSNPLLPTVAPRGLVHCDATVQALVEIIHAFTLVDVSNIDIAAQLYMKFFLCKDPVISFGAKQALVRVLRPKTRKRRVFIPSPPHCETPSGAGHPTELSKAPSQSASSTTSERPSQMASQGSLEVFSHDNLISAGSEQQFDLIEHLDEVGGAAGGVEELMVGAGGQFAPLLDLPADADDEAMVELAIALSLQDQQPPGGGIPDIGASGRRVSEPVGTPQRGASLEERGHYSDTTASAAASDDEGSTAATDGSTLRTSPVINEPEHVADGVGSESGASGAESIIGEQVSGRSSAYGEEGTPSTSKGTGMMDSHETAHESADFDLFDTNNQKLHSIRILLLEKLIQRLSDLRELGGINCIPMMQVILMLTTDLENEGDRDKNVLFLLLNSLINELYYDSKDISLMAQRTPNHEVKLIIMRLLSILMSRVKLSTSVSTSFKIGTSQQQESASIPALCSIITTQTLINSNIIDLCLQILISLLDYWKAYQQEIENTKSTQPQQQPQPQQTPPTSSAPLKPRSIASPPDMSPFFLKQYVKSHGDDVFESYPQLLTEMVLRLPYQMKKISSSVPNCKQVVFTPIWLEQLCEYMMIQLTPYVRKQVRKLLSFICGSKDKYRQIRDFHALDSHLKEVKKICKSGGFTESLSHSGQGMIISLSYDSTISLIEHLKACCEIASSRVTNWQIFCNKDPSVLTFFTQVSFLLDEGVSPIVLQLLQLALCSSSSNQSKPGEGGIKVPVTILQGTTSVSPSSSSDGLYESLNSVLARQLISQIDKSNSTSLRWQAHSLIYNLYKSFDGQYHEQVRLLETLWSLWCKVPNYGRKAAQFVDVLGYFTLKIPTSEERARDYTEKALFVLRQQNKLLMNHPNSTVYNTLQSLVEFDGYYLESEPCLVCNNPEVNYTNMKLSSIKSDSRYTTTTHIVKLLGSHTITKISLRISDIKRSKMVKTLNLYYNNRAVHSVVELKNKTNIWHKAKKCNLAPVQTEVKIEFTLPIVACNLMIEYADFYENIQASSETLQCPRCSASVAANPGVCGNCGENVFQCHKCRAINYDEKDPFLCNSCGFCKYAKFDYVLTAKPTCAVDPIENEEDRKKTVQTINNLLEKADRVYKSLIANKPTLELLLFRIQEHGLMTKMTDEVINSVSTNNTSTVNTQSTGHVNKAIQQVAQKYCGDCKGAFDELSKIIQKVLASRKELVDYDNRQREKNANPTGQGQGATRRDSKVIASLSSASGRCYGCASATTEHCITLLKALATVPKYLHILCNSGLLKELLNFNLRHGKGNVRQEVRQLLCTLTYDNPRATTELNNMIMDKVVTSFKSKYGQRLELSTTVRHEIALLVCSLGKEDSCWEQRLRCVMQLFLMGLSVDNPAVLESITLPCLKLLINLIKPEPPTSKKNKDKTIEQMSNVRVNGFQVSVDLNKWLLGDTKHSFRSWKQHCQKKLTSSINTAEDEKNSKIAQQLVHNLYLMEVYGNRWREKVLSKKSFRTTITLNRGNWLLSILFNRFSRTVRLMACSLVEALFQVPSRRKELIDMLTSYLDELGNAGEFSQEFFLLYYNIIQQDHWKYYLALKGVLVHLGDLITKEIDKLNILEETTLNSDLSEGIALKMLVELLSLLMEVSSIKQQYKSRLVAFVLNGYLSLRKLVVQRTKIIDEAQDTLLELLEEMTTGTESETASFMAVCVDAINKCKLDDLRTPVFIFERLCSIIYPEENDTTEFFITLEKDPQQEDFLQGRMLGNPYSSNEPGMGPLMRDIKNKICQDCELVALLEDDSGMELLVRNKIISLDLPVKDVYRKIWCTENNESDAMRIVYRMRGLMGDATEEFIQTLDSKNSQNVDNEEVYKMANVMSQCGGLQVMLQRLNVIKDLSARCRPLLFVLLKLFGHCVNVRSNRLLLIQPSLNAIGVMLNILKMFFTTEGSEALTGPSTAGKPSSLEQLLLIMEKVLEEASNQPMEKYDEFCRLTCGTKEDIQFLLKAVSNQNVRGNTNIIQLVLRIIPLMTDSDHQKNTTLLHHFKNHLNFNKFDYEHNSEDDFVLDSFCLLVNGIQKNVNGNRLKDFILENRVVADALEYLTIHSPPVKSALLATSDEWKEFTQRPALKYVLRILTGLASGHEATQMLVSADCIPIIHGLEQVSSDSHVGSLAEILLEKLLQNPKVAVKIELVRKQTREEKKRLAMAVRQKQLGELGMRANEKGQVTASSIKLKQVEDLGEEQGLVCIICREGYKFQPTKVIGIYTFTKKCNVEPFEVKPRKTVGYSTVTHFNVVHVDCHMAAVRHARGRDEWESAALQNANTKCNGLLPLWGPSVQESAYASALAKHNNYLQECTGHRDIGYSSTVHDLKLLLLKFASEESFSVDTGGGGHQSNIHLIPYLIHMALYVINTTRCGVKENRKVSAFLELSASKWVENSFEAEGPYYWLTMFAVLNSPSAWANVKISFLKRLLVMSQARHLHSKGCVALDDKQVKDYSVYKTALTFFGLVDGLYNILFKNVVVDADSSDSWTFVLADYIRNNDVALSENADKLLKFYEQDLLHCESFAEYAVAAGLLNFIDDTNNFIANSLMLSP